MSEVEAQPSIVEVMARGFYDAWVRSRDVPLPLWHDLRDVEQGALGRNVWRLAARSALERVEAAGFVVVPALPDAAQVRAGRAEIKPDNLPADDGDVRACYRAMVGARPR